jgi:DNA-binding NarL/FixJ family response regulator
MTAVRVLVVDDQQLVRDGIASLLGIQPGIEVVGTAADGAEAVVKALETAPDVVLMDVRMPGTDGVEATRELCRRLPGCRVVMLTTFDDDDYVTRALRAGATGYLLKDLGAADLAAAVRLTHAGVAPLAAGVAARLAAPPAEQGVLTAREVEILRLVAKGATNREIGRVLFVSEGTVKNHVSRVLGRLGLRDRTQAAIYAREHGLLTD